MNKNLRIIFFSVLLVIMIICLIGGGTFAYFNASLDDDGNSIGGDSYNFSMDIMIGNYIAGNLIPVDDSLVSSSINGNSPCVDLRNSNYYLCSFYQVVVTNSGQGASFAGGLVTSASDYTSNHLKYQLYSYDENSGIYSPISDALSVSHTSNAVNYFKLNQSNMSFSIDDGTDSPIQKEYYLAIWLSDSHTNQLEDRDRSYTGAIMFESSGGRIISSFITA